MSLLNIFHLISPYLFLINMILLLVFFYINRLGFFKIIKHIGKKYWIYFFFALLFAFFIRVIIPFSHNIWVDEFTYVLAAEELLENFSTGHERLIGWPMTLFFIFLFSGFGPISNIIAIYVGLLFGILSLLVFFIFAYILTENKIVSFFAVFLLSLMPSFIKWSVSAETNISSFFFSMLFIMFLVHYCKKPSKNMFWLVLFSLSFSLFFRPENVLLLVMFVFSFFYLIPNLNIKTKSLILPFLIFVLLALPNITIISSFYVFNTRSPGYEDLRVLKENISLNTFLQFHNVTVYHFFKFALYFFLFLVSFFFIGLFYSYFSEKKIFYYLLFYFTLYYIFVLASSPGQYSIGAVDRFNMLLFPSISLIISYGIYFFLKNSRNLKTIFSVLIILFLIWSYFNLYFDDTSYFANEKGHQMTRMPLDIHNAFTPHCTIIAMHEEYFLGTDFEIIPVHYISEDRLEYIISQNNDCLLFFESFYCLENKVCTNLMSGLNLSLNKTFAHQNMYNIIS